jgi:hypothetical protein
MEEAVDRRRLQLEWTVRYRVPVGSSWWHWWPKWVVGETSADGAPSGLERTGVVASTLRVAHGWLKEDDRRKAATRMASGKAFTVEPDLDA